ncbi:MAG: carbohydrate-binding family 9-like protein [Acidobacteriota bacterium]|nr:carbohydrate-binding family 9-like protein [Acidobacteriota bacterium]
MKNQINAFFTSKEIKLEDFDVEIWRQSESIEINRYWSGEQAPAERCASARILWNETKLFARFDCRQGEPFIINRNPNLEIEAEELWERDCCEIFIAPNSNEPEKYFEFEAAPTGEWLDFAIRQLPDKREVNKTYNAGMKTAACIQKDSFTVVFSVEFERAFGKKPEAGEAWRANLFRCVGSGETRGYLAWQPTFTPKPSFHVPGVFGIIKFTK